MTQLPAEVEARLKTLEHLRVRSVHFKAVVMAMRHAPELTDAELAEFLLIALAEVCEGMQKVQDELLRVTMLTTRPIHEIFGGLLACVPSSPAAEPTDPGPGSKAESPT